MSALRLRYTALSDVGRVRKDNQDSGYAGEHLLAIADGVGGAARGDVASSTAVAQLRRLDDPPGNDVLEAIAGAIHRAHDRIAELVDEDPELDGTSTTVTAAVFDGTRIGVGHVGDSRGYLLRDGTISLLTKDHTFVQSLIDEGRITEEESRVHPHRNLILRAVDGVHETEPDLFLVDLAPGDRIMLCSDGCSGSLTDDRLAEILGEGSIDQAAAELIRSALDAGSSDNVTVVVADVVAADDDNDDSAEGLASASTGPMLVGAAAADQPTKGTSKSAGVATHPGRRGKRTDTGEIEPVDSDAQEGDVDTEVLRYAPRAPRRFLWLRRIVVLVVVLALVALAAFAAYSWSQKQYYVATKGERVAIYKGVAAKLPGVSLHKVFETTDVDLDTLPDYNSRQVRDGIDASGLADARAIVKRLRGMSTCATTPTTPTTPATPNATPGAKPTKGTKSQPATPKTTAPTTPTTTTTPGTSTDCPEAP